MTKEERRLISMKNLGLPKKRENNPNWKGGKIKRTKQGHIAIKINGHHLADSCGYVLEHRLIMEKKIGRKLAPKEIVHHIDGNAGNNAIENLELLPSHSYHAYRHAQRKRSDLKLPWEENTIVCCECGCGDSFLRFDNKGRPRMFISGHNGRVEGYNARKRMKNEGIT